jgi:hypothetical protein
MFDHNHRHGICIYTSFPCEINKVYITSYVVIYDRNSVVGIVIGRGMDGPGFEPGGDEIFRTLPDWPRVPLTPVQWVPDLFSAVKATFGMTAWCSDVF